MISFNSLTVCLIKGKGRSVIITPLTIVGANALVVEDWLEATVPTTRTEPKLYLSSLGRRQPYIKFENPIERKMMHSWREYRGGYEPLCLSAPDHP